MSIYKKITFTALLLFSTTLWGKSQPRNPNIAYLYPAGAQAGTSVVITAGGQYLRGPEDVYISGQGLQCEIIKYIKPLVNINRDQREAIKKMMKRIRDKRFGEMNIKNRVIDDYLMQKDQDMEKDLKDPDVKIDEVEPPDHPLFYDIENKSLRELQHINSVIFASARKRQRNRQLSEWVLIKITVAPDAKPGFRELRLKTRTGMTKPIRFQVGQFPEMQELEPNERKNYFRAVNVPKLSKTKPIELPITINGQILPGDVDKFRFSAKKGQKIVIETQARSLIPYLADSVPGWFQATIALYDFKGKEIAFADDYRFNPDPVLFYEIPNDGEYDLEIHDAIYRGREDFVYRVSIGNQPFVTEIFPPGAQADAKTTASIKGWNLGNEKIKLNTKQKKNIIKHKTAKNEELFSNPVAYHIDTIQDCNEIQNNNSIKQPQQIQLPVIINGKISKPGDIDVFEFKCHAGQSIIAEVYGRRINSPIDSILKLTDENGTAIKINDDYVQADKFLHKDKSGLITHHADSYLQADIEHDGTYYLHVADIQNHGGDEYFYRLRVSQPRPDFALRSNPSSLTVRSGGYVPMDVYVLRKDGFDGEIELALKDAPEGFKLIGGKIPARCNKTTITLKSPYSKLEDKVLRLNIQGTAWINKKPVSHKVVGSDDVMQAFLYRHLMPAKELIFLAQKSRWKPILYDITNKYPIKIKPGDKTKVVVKTWKWALDRNPQLELIDPPAGITLEGTSTEKNNLIFWIKASKDLAQKPISGNLIIETYLENKPKKGQPVKLSSAGYMPAIEFDIVNQ